MELTVHHTCSKEGEKEDVLKNAPFISIYDENKAKKPFLGEGYYFWEFNLEYAKYWGKSHYKNDFYVCEFDVYLDIKKEGYFLDLVGSRKHLSGFVDLLMEFNLIHEDGTKGIDLSFIINYLRTNCPDAFPFKVVRAVDNQNSELEGIKISFNDKTKSYTFLNPRIIIAYRNKEDIIKLKETFITFAS